MGASAFWDRETFVRAASGAAFVALLLSAAVFGPWPLLALWLFIGLGSFVEWRRHAGAGSPPAGQMLRLFLFLGLAGVMVSLPWSAGGDYDPKHVWLFLVLVWTNDTLAYVFGRLFGRHKLMPAVSPGKTWEGFVGGVFSAALVGGLWQSQTGFATVGALVGGLTGVLATAGDLTQSAWKRKRGLKDSGQIMPGHGGFLDRFDGFLYALPVYGLIAWVLGAFF